MNAAQIHLALNHLPPAFLLIAIPLLLIALSKKLSQVKLVAMALFIVSAIATIPVFLSGEPTEEILEHLPGISSSDIHEHEEFAEITIVLSTVLGVFALGFLIAEQLRFFIPKWSWALFLLVGTVTLVFLIRTAHLGGLIHHSELHQTTSMTDLHD